MPERVAYALRPARKAFDGASADIQREYDAVIRSLCEDPHVAPPIKVKFDVPPVVVYLYNDDNVWVVYYLPDDLTVEVWNIGKAPDPPSPR